MQIKANKLTETGTTHLIFTLLSQSWPETAFTCTTKAGELSITWEDGPWEEDVFRATTTYLAPLDNSDWDNVVILAHPGGTIEAVLPAIHSVTLTRTLSERMLQKVTAELSCQGKVIDIDLARSILSDINQANEDKLDLLARLNRFCLPLPSTDLFTERRRTSEDTMIIELCNALDKWCSGGETLDRKTFLIVTQALKEAEGRAVLISALSDEAPIPGHVADLIEQVTQQCLVTREYETADFGHYVLASVFEDLNAAQPGLFRTERPEMETLNEMGRLLRETVAGARF